jgi:hypothetical protein
MSELHTKFSQTLDDLTAEEEAWLRDQLRNVCYYGAIECDASQGRPANCNEPLIYRGPKFLYENDEYDDVDMLVAGFQYRFMDAACAEHAQGANRPAGRSGRKLLLYADTDGLCDECGYPAHAAILVQAFIRRFRPDGYWWLSYADTCDRPEPDRFGGGAFFVTANRVSMHTVYDWIDEQIAAIKAQGRRPL